MNIFPQDAAPESSNNISSENGSPVSNDLLKKMATSVQKRKDIVTDILRHYIGCEINAGFFQSHPDNKDDYWEHWFSGTLLSVGTDGSVEVEIGGIKFKQLEKTAVQGLINRYTTRNNIYLFDLTKNTDYVEPVLYPIEARMDYHHNGIAAIQDKYAGKTDTHAILNCGAEMVNFMTANYFDVFNLITDGLAQKAEGEPPQKG